MPVIKQDCVPSWIAEEAASAVGALLVQAIPTYSRAIKPGALRPTPPSCRRYFSGSASLKCSAMHFRFSSNSGHIAAPHEPTQWASSDQMPVSELAGFPKRWLAAP